MASQPDGMLQWLLRHMMQLFDVPQLEQLPAVMNKVGTRGSSVQVYQMT
jgi:hypothetical protein